MLIKAMETREEIIGKAFVHWKTWQEAYVELLSSYFLKTVRTLESCQELAFRYPQNTLIALVDNQVVGFACYGDSSQKDLKKAGELYAIYILADYYDQGIGYQFMQEALKKCRATNGFLSGCWREMCVPFLSVKRWTSALTA